MQVNLPQKDSPEDQAKRQAWLTKNRKKYEFNPDYLKPLTVLRDVPKNESFSAKYLAERVPNTLAELSGNALAVKFRSLWDPLDELQDFEDFYPTLKDPKILRSYQTDEAFAEQRLAGANPMVIRRISTWPDTATYSIEEVQQAVGESLALDKLLAEGHLFIADYKSLKYVKGGTYQKGHKYLPTPLAFFAWQKLGYQTRGNLVPVAIQLNSPNDPKGSLVNPFSPPNQWLYAKICVQIADANHHEMATHLCLTHLVMEPFAISTARQLSPTHPLNLLLTPHFQFMLYNNELARNQLINQGGIVDDLLAGTLQESLLITQTAYENWALDTSALPMDIKSRGMELDSQDDLPHYPYRDDGLLLWQAITNYVTEYLQIYYTSPEDVQGDYELQGWAQELTEKGDEGGHVKGMPSKIETVEKLIEIVTTIIFTCGPQHSAVNFTQYDYMGFIPNAPLAAYQPIQTQFESEISKKELMAFLPPSKQVMGQIQILYALSDYRYDKLGYYDRNFLDRQANVALARFRQRLNTIENKIIERNKKRWMSYDVLRPSLVLNSISI